MLSPLGHIDSARSVDAQTLAKLSTLTLRVNAVVEGVMAGIHRSRRYGSSIEYAEHKDYTPGDDLRRIDWKSYAKTDRYHVKQFENETALCVYLLLDASGSMGYGAPLTKLDYAAVLLGALAHLWVNQRDPVSVVVFDEAMRSWIPPSGKQSHLPLIVSSLQSTESLGKTDLAATLEQLGERLHQRSMVILVSDLFDRSGRVVPLLKQLRAKKHELALFHLLHPDEISFPFTELTQFQSMEATAPDLVVDPLSVRKQYRDRMQQFLDETERECRAMRMSYRKTVTDEALDRVLLEFWQALQR